MGTQLTNAWKALLLLSDHDQSDVHFLSINASGTINDATSLYDVSTPLSDIPSPRPIRSTIISCPVTSTAFQFHETKWQRWGAQEI